MSNLETHFSKNGVINNQINQNIIENQNKQDIFVQKTCGTTHHIASLIELIAYVNGKKGFITWKKCHDISTGNVQPAHESCKTKNIIKIAFHAFQKHLTQEYDTIENTTEQKNTDKKNAQIFCT